jgi:hypothetical protein
MAIRPDVIRTSFSTPIRGPKGSTQALSEVVRNDCQMIEGEKMARPNETPKDAANGERNLTSIRRSTRFLWGYQLRDFSSLRSLVLKPEGSFALEI